MLRLMNMRPWVLGVALVVASGCTDTGNGTAAGTVPVTGVLIEVGGPSGAANTPAEGTISYKGKNGATASFATLGDGSWRLALSPGVYTFTGRSPLYGGNQGQCSSDPVTVEAVAVNHVQVVCSRS